MKEKNFDKYFAISILISLNLQFLLLPLLVILYPPSMHDGHPVYAPESMVLNNLGLAFTMIGSTLLGIKLADDKRVLAASGFTAYAISCGVVMASSFEIMNPLSEEGWEKAYYITTSANFIYLPAMLLIAANDEFRKWVRWVGVVSAIPYDVSAILFMSGGRNYAAYEIINTVGYLMMLVAQMMWSINVWRNYREKLK